jgi:hypothetical protein
MDCAAANGCVMPCPGLKYLPGLLPEGTHDATTPGNGLMFAV